MAGSPDWKIYRGKEYVACCKYTEDAAMLVAAMGDGATIRFGHGVGFTVWREGHEAQSAGESYDQAGLIMEARRAEWEGMDIDAWLEADVFQAITARKLEAAGVTAAEVAALNRASYEKAYGTVALARDTPKRP